MRRIVRYDHSSFLMCHILILALLQGIDIFAFVLATFRVDDEEVQNIHLPLIFCALVEKLEVNIAF